MTKSIGNTIENENRGFYILGATMDSLGERVRRAREAAGLSQGDLAKALDIKQPSVHALEHSKSNRSKHTLELARTLKVRPQWLETGSGPMLDTAAESGERQQLAESPPEPLRRAEFSDEVLSPRTLARDLPVLGIAACGENGLFEFNVGGDPIDVVRRPPRLAGIKDGYALYVQGESMIPWRKPGKLVYVHPGLSAQIEDYVVVQLRPRREAQSALPAAYIKELVRQNSDRIVLRQYNPPKEITLKRSEILHIHRILDQDDLFGI